MHHKQITTKTVKQTSCIYGILNLVTDRIYIGQTKNLYKRWIGHRTALQRGEHDNKYLQNSWNKHGEDVFDFLIIEVCENLTEREKYHIEKFSLVYNMRDAADHSNGMKGKKHSDSSKKKMSDARKGIVPDNYNEMHKIRWKKVCYSIDDQLVEIFESVAAAGRHFNMPTNIIHQYIGKTRKTKKFPKGYKLEYYDEKNCI